MKIIGLTINSIIIFLVISYILLLEFNGDMISDIIDELFNNLLFRIFIILLIILLTIGDNKTNIGGILIGILLIIAYIMSDIISPLNSNNKI
jgi:hypothetical protein